jgi:nucleoside 2-deoxyribosyltransferase
MPTTLGPTQGPPVPKRLSCATPMTEGPRACMRPSQLESPQSDPMYPVKVFLSHARQDSTVVKATSAELSWLGIIPFLAPDNIPSAQKWLPRLEHELTTCNALVAFLTPSFQTSSWTNQEVGYAVAKRKRVLSVQLDSQSTPPGFIQQYQAILADGMSPHDIAASIFDDLLKYDETSDHLKKLVVSRLRNERSELVLRRWAMRLDGISEMSASDVTGLATALDANPMISTNPALRNEISAIVDRLANQKMVGPS